MLKKMMDKTERIGMKTQHLKREGRAGRPVLRHRSKWKVS